MRHLRILLVLLLSATCLLTATGEGPKPPRTEQGRQENPGRPEKPQSAQTHHERNQLNGHRGPPLSKETYKAAHPAPTDPVEEHNPRPAPRQPHTPAPKHSPAPELPAHLRHPAPKEHERESAFCPQHACTVRVKNMWIGLAGLPSCRRCRSQVNVFVKCDLRFQMMTCGFEWHRPVLNLGSSGMLPRPLHTMPCAAHDSLLLLHKGSPTQVPVHN